MNKIEQEMRLREYRLLHYLLETRERLGITNRKMYEGLCMSKRVWNDLKHADEVFCSLGKLPKKKRITHCPGIWTA